MVLFAMRPNLQQVAQEALLDSGLERQDVRGQAHLVGDDDFQAGPIRAAEAIAWCSSVQRGCQASRKACFPIALSCSWTGIGQEQYPLRFGPELPAARPLGLPSPIEVIPLAEITANALLTASSRMLSTVAAFISTVAALSACQPAGLSKARWLTCPGRRATRPSAWEVTTMCESYHEGSAPTPTRPASASGRPSLTRFRLAGTGPAHKGKKSH